MKGEREIRYVERENIIKYKMQMNSKCVKFIVFCILQSFTKIDVIALKFCTTTLLFFTYYFYTIYNSFFLKNNIYIYIYLTKPK